MLTTIFLIIIAPLALGIVRTLMEHESDRDPSIRRTAFRDQVNRDSMRLLNGLMED